MTQHIIDETPERVGGWPAPKAQIRYQSLHGLWIGMNALIACIMLFEIAITATAWWVALTPRLPGFNYNSPYSAVATSDMVDGIVNLVMLFPLLAAWIVSMVWLWRVRTNAEQMSAAKHRRHKAWIILGWFIPIASLFVPYQVVSDVERNSDPDAAPHARELVRSTATVVGWWWATFLVYSVLGNMIGRMFFNLDHLGVTELRIAAVLQTGCLVFVFPAGILWYVVTKRIQDQQARRAHEFAARFPGSVARF